MVGRTLQDWRPPKLDRAARESEVNSYACVDRRAIDREIVGLWNEPNAGFLGMVVVIAAAMVVLAVRMTRAH